MLEQFPPAARTALRAVAGIGIAIAAGYGTLVLSFVGTVELVDCFIECGEGPNVLAGSLLLAGAVLCASATLTSVVWGAIGWQPRTLRRVATTVAGIASIILLVIFAGLTISARR